MKVSEYMSTTTEIATPDTTLSQIAKQLAANNVSCVVIVEKRKPVGKRLSMKFTSSLASSNMSNTYVFTSSSYLSSATSYDE